MRPNKGHDPAFDGIRGLAIAFVLIYHFTMGLDPTRLWSRLLLKCGSIGWCGVDLFFVLSGFLITGLLIDVRCDLDREGASHPFLMFFVKRALRIFPLYFCVLLGLNAIPTPLGFEGTAETSFWTSTFQTNTLVAIRQGWFPLSHFWSLAVEEHFYLVWPFVVIFGGRRFALRSCVALLLIGILTRTYLVSQGATLAAYVLTICRVDSIAIGGALALWLRDDSSMPIDIKRRRIHKIGNGAFLVLGFLILWRRGLAFYDPVVQIMGYPTLAMASASLIGRLAIDPETDRPSTLRIICEHGWLRHLGRISFGLYVFNSIAILVLDGQNVKATIRQFTGSTFAADLGYIAFGVALTFGAAWLSWIAIEKPAMRARRYFESQVEPERKVQSNQKIIRGKIARLIEVSST